MKAYLCHSNEDFITHEGTRAELETWATEQCSGREHASVMDESFVARDETGSVSQYGTGYHWFSLEGQ